jgi:hypothetical protein
MIHCRLDFNNLYDDGRVARLDSEGCITFFRNVDFYMVRGALLRAHKHKVLGGNELWAYGDITVIGNTNGVCNVKAP